MQWTESAVQERLDNGVTVVVQADDTIPVVAVVTHVRAGYFDEPDEWTGISHVLEHMFFKGTARLPPGGLARETQQLGGYLNAGTIYDKTVYYAVTPAAEGGLQRTMALQADALMHAALDADELARELEVIIQEANRKLDNPAAVTGEMLYELLFTRHRMRRWRIGTEEGLRRLGPDDVGAYYRTRYTPDRTIIGLAGRLDPDDALALAHEVYGGWDVPRHEVPGSPSEPAGGEGRLRILTGDVERPRAAIGWKTVGPLHDDAPALDVAASVLGEGRGSRLYRHVCLPGLAGGATAGHYTPLEVGVFDMTLTGDGGRFDAAVRRSLDLAGELAATGPSAEELDRVRALIRTQWARRLESADGRATALCDFEALGGVELGDEYLRRLLAVDPPTVQAAAARYLTGDRVSAVLYLPDEMRTGLSEDAWPPS